MKKILLTGASGFFGRSTIDAFKKSSEKFTCYCTYNDKKFDIDDARFEWVKLDLLNPQAVSQKLSDLAPSACISLAWYVPPKEFWESPDNRKWVEATTHLFKSFCANNGQTFVGAGSIAEYLWSDQRLDEVTATLKPASLYGQCKLQLHQNLQHFKDQHHPAVALIWPRIGYFFGPHEPAEKLMTTLIKKIRNSEPLKLADAHFKRPYAHIKYAGEILAALALKSASEDIVFNLSADKSYTLKEIVEFIAKIHQKENISALYGAYAVSQPLELKIATDRLAHQIKLPIADTFFADLKEFAESMRHVI